MKRRKLLRSLLYSGAAIPSAYLLGPSTARAARESPALAPSHGCGRNDAGQDIPKHGVIARDFIDPQLELIRLLKEASEIEHSLMIQYIFAAYSLKPAYRSLVGPPVPSSDSLMGIAIEEMQHLAAVNKLLVALGSIPNLGRQDFPYEIDIYPFPFRLEKLTKASLARYTYVEAGRQSMPMRDNPGSTDQAFCDELTRDLGTDTGLNRVAGLYELILSQMDSMESAGTLQLADFDRWKEQLIYIMEEGETNHFRFFRSLYMGEHELFADAGNPWALPEDHPDFPAFDVEPNPTAYWAHEHQIMSQEARAYAWLGNLHYWLVLMMLDVHYRYDSPQLNSIAQTHMVGPLQSLAVRLADYRTGLPFDNLSMGYAPGPDAGGSIEFIRRLGVEAETYANKMGDDLPPGYPLGLHQVTQQILAAEAKRLGNPASV
jgi:hypothetical protein